MSTRDATIVGAFTLAALVGGAIFLSRSEAPKQQKRPPLEVPWVKSSSSAGLQLEESRPSDELRSIVADRKRSPEERVQAIFHLAKANDWNSIDTLTDQLEDDSPLVRGRAAAAIRHILGTDFYFRAEDSQAKRSAAIDGIRRYWRSRKDNPPALETKGDAKT